MTGDSRLIFEAYKKKTLKESIGLGPHAEGEGLSAPIQQNIQLNPETSVEESDEFDAGEDIQKFTDIAKQKLFRIHRIAEELHELIDHHAFKPWMADKITQSLDDLNSIYDKVDYEASVKTGGSNVTPESIPQEIGLEFEEHP